MVSIQRPNIVPLKEHTTTRLLSTAHPLYQLHTPRQGIALQRICNITKSHTTALVDLLHTLWRNTVKNSMRLISQMLIIVRDLQ